MTKTRTAMAKIAFFCERDRNGLSDDAAIKAASQNTGFSEMEISESVKNRKTRIS